MIFATTLNIFQQCEHAGQLTFVYLGNELVIGIQVRKVVLKDCHCSDQYLFILTLFKKKTVSLFWLGFSFLCVLLP